MSCARHSSTVSSQQLLVRLPDLSRAGTPVILHTSISVFSLHFLSVSVTTVSAAPAGVCRIHCIP